MEKRIVGATFGLICLLAYTPLALAQVHLVTSTPVVEGTVHGPVVAVNLKFNSRVDGKRSRLILVFPKMERRRCSRRRSSPRLKSLRLAPSSNPARTYCASKAHSKDQLLESFSGRVGTRLIRIGSEQLLATQLALPLETPDSIPA